jgi:hypothetical protein
MSQKPNTLSQERPSYCAVILDKAENIARFIGAGAWSGYTFSIINPIGGAIFGANSALLYLAGTGIAHLTGIRVHWIALRVFCLFVSIPVSAAATTAFGFPVTVLGGAKLMLALVVYKTAIDLGIFGLQVAKGAGDYVVDGVKAAKQRFF